MASYLPVLLFLTLVASVAPCANHCSPMFTASRKRNFNVKVNDIIRYPSIISQCGDGYNPATGKFTASIAGYYGFATSVRVSIGAVVFLRIVKNGEYFASCSAGSPNKVDHTKTMSFIHLEKADQVYVQVVAMKYRPQLTGYNYTTFSGWKV